MSEVHAVIFDNKIWDIKGAIEWLYKHKIYPIKQAHRTKNTIRFRIREQLPGVVFRTIDVASGIKFVLMFA